MTLKKPVYNWYAIYTKPNAEKRIVNYLDEKDIESYLPLKKALRQWSDRKKWIEEPVFRCYLFIRVSHIEFFKILEVPGVVKYVSFGGKPQTIPEDQIKDVKILVEQQEREIFLSHENIKKGKKVEVLFGPFKGMHGEVTQIHGKSRLVLKIDALGCNLYANINKDEVRAITQTG
ncbi:transcription antitermination protein nusG [Mariniphaga anaerophila]|uniref:Transcription antitermination protein nusG n=1 Tax=Mariniphaga anaerophila TaxID=1484053 RepID=A0A1M5BJT2_9BACT|nr:UpxY family transcription antiterminator [Mariniphaga anaerophila]SHF42791.1 transcription antitermination protein nusG [Mariniphaga anaerophila]